MLVIDIRYFAQGQNCMGSYTANLHFGGLDYLLGALVGGRGEQNHFSNIAPLTVTPSL